MSRRLPIATDNPRRTSPPPPATADAGDWFGDGVFFRCLGPECGDCCSGKQGPGAVWVDGEDLRRLAAHLRLSKRELRRRYVRRLGRRESLTELANYDCVFYDSERGCTVYEARPTQCRAYPFWGRIMATRVTWELEAERCPGIDRRESLIDAAEVRRQIAATRRRSEPPPS